MLACSRFEGNHYIWYFVAGVTVKAGSNAGTRNETRNRNKMKVCRNFLCETALLLFRVPFCSVPRSCVPAFTVALVAVRIKQFTVEIPILFISLIATVYHFSTFQPSCNQTLDSLLQLSALMQEASYSYIHFATVINFTQRSMTHHVISAPLTTHRLSNRPNIIIQTYLSISTK